ncbi:HAMP domain-containing sensor histidine kinase [Curtobacterium pusillum]|uniref:sensor histidine kinase n=1 Tax=Curtobacterium pusillum TaxID=69373 RepID=UPI0011A6A9E5|nr:HAMP domain-containing sensor histidine kinase [Curtobacterium pusillum]
MIRDRPDDRLDPDRMAVRRSAVRIGWQVAAVSAGLVVLIIGLVLAYVLWQSSPREELERHRSDATRIFVDSDELIAVLAVVGGGAVVLAGVATWVIARRAVLPLGEALRMQRTFVADASHELRTPLTVMSTRVQQLQRRMDPEDPNGAVVAELRDDTRALAAIVDDLLQAATMHDDDADPSRNGGTSVHAEILRTAQDLQVLASERDVRILVDRTEAVVAIPATPFRRCILALVDNAVGHAPSGSTVEVTVVERAGLVDIAVRDHGRGITGIDPERVFDRFAHGAPAAGPDTPRSSYGIGLALVRELAVRHHGSVRVARTGSEGTEFVLTLPRAVTIRTARD